MGWSSVEEVSFGLKAEILSMNKLREFPQRAGEGTTGVPSQALMEGISTYNTTWVFCLLLEIKVEIYSGLAILTW